jgi:hypothetical protein
VLAPNNSFNPTAGVGLGISEKHPRRRRVNSRVRGHMGERSQLISRLLLLVVSVPAAALIALLLYDRIWYVPRLEQIRSMVSRGNPQDQFPPPLVKRMVRASEGNNLYWHINRIVLDDSLPALPPRTNDLNNTFLVSFLLTRLHVSESEALGIYCSRTYANPTSNGLSNVSKMLFNKPLSTLSPIEAATVAAWPSGPSYFLKHPAALNQRRDRIFAQAGSGP